MKISRIFFIFPFIGNFKRRRLLSRELILSFNEVELLNKYNSFKCYNNMVILSNIIFYYYNILLRVFDIAQYCKN